MIDYIKTGNQLVISNIKRSLGRNTPAPPEPDEISYISQVEEVLDKNEISAVVPIYQGKLIRLPEKTLYNMIFHTARGMVHFEGRIEGYYKEDETHLMKIRLLSNGEIVQRREFFRFPCRLPLKFAEVKEGETLFQDDMLFGIINDLSGGGMRFFSNDKVAEDAKISCILELGADSLLLIGKIVGRDDLKEGSYTFDYRVIFAGILESDQQRIVRYIFNEQRQQLKTIR